MAKTSGGGGGGRGAGSSVGGVGSSRRNANQRSGRSVGTAGRRTGGGKGGSSSNLTAAAPQIGRTTTTTYKHGPDRGKPWYRDTPVTRTTRAGYQGAALATVRQHFDGQGAAFSVRDVLGRTIATAGSSREARAIAVRYAAQKR